MVGVGGDGGGEGLGECGRGTGVDSKSSLICSSTDSSWCSTRGGRG